MNEAATFEPAAADRRRFLQSVAAGIAILTIPNRLTGDVVDPGALPITGRANEALKSLDRMMTSFVTLYDIAGGAMAVTRNGRLVYARGFGYADLEKKVPVQPDTLFRIASVSKPVTGTAVLRLVEKGELSLTDRAFDILGLKPHLEGDRKADPRLKDVTVQQLLHHTAGWDRTMTPDPMGQFVSIAKALGVEPPAMQEHIIRYMMGKPLDFPPGLRDAYSNFGYCVLGRIIEKVSGRGYEDYVRTEVLAPLGVTRMRIGKTLREGRAADESCYYEPLQPTGPSVMGTQVGKSVPSPYGTFCLEAMDSHGGWIASAIDLARFAVAFDAPDRCNILNAKSVSTMFGRPPGNAGYDGSGVPKVSYQGCGWMVRPQGETGALTTWHQGGLPGSSAYIVRRYDGINWVWVFNTMMSPHGVSLCDLIDPYGHVAVGKVKSWPEIDLFVNDKAAQNEKSGEPAPNKAVNPTGGSGGF